MPPPGLRNASCSLRAAATPLSDTHAANVSVGDAIVCYGTYTASQEDLETDAGRLEFSASAASATLALVARQGAAAGDGSVPAQQAVTLIMQAQPQLLVDVVAADALQPSTSGARLCARQHACRECMRAGRRCMRMHDRRWQRLARGHTRTWCTCYLPMRLQAGQGCFQRLWWCPTAATCAWEASPLLVATTTAASSFWPRARAATAP
jgi:hypothetical protein